MTCHLGPPSANQEIGLGPMAETTRRVCVSSVYTHPPVERPLKSRDAPHNVAPTKPFIPPTTNSVLTFYPPATLTCMWALSTPSCLCTQALDPNQPRSAFLPADVLHRELPPWSVPPLFLITSLQWLVPELPPFGNLSVVEGGCSSFLPSNFCA